MEQHPIPQHVSGYEFRLIGDMTLKQFVELAFGVILAVVCWYLPLPSLFRYPLVVFFGILGIGLAFVPINERPLDRWIVSFFKSIYSPTKFIYEKSEVPLEILTRPTATKISDLAQQLPAVDRKKLQEYLKSIPSAQISPFDQAIEENLQRISELFDQEIKPPKMIKFPKIKREAHKTIKPKFEPKLPMPSKPTSPNILVGMVLDDQGKMLANAIIEIRDQDGFPVRALKTNQLGQFKIATPLKNGVYELELEKEGFQFDIIKFEAKGEIIEPLEIKAKAKID